MINQGVFHVIHIVVINYSSVFFFVGTAMFLHWLVGMVYVFYFASFVLLLREVLRPGVLWFLRNLNDPDFQPVQEVRNVLNRTHSLVHFVLPIQIM